MTVTPDMPVLPVVQFHVARPSALVRGAGATGLQVTASAGSMVGPVEWRGRGSQGHCEAVFVCV